MVRHPYASRRFVTLMVFLIAAGCACASNGERMATQEFARSLGYPGCKVTAPMNQSAVLDAVRRRWLNDPKKHPDWSRIEAIYRVGDEFRYVSCMYGHRRGAPGYSFYAMIRGRRVMLEAFQELDN